MWWRDDHLRERESEREIMGFVAHNEEVVLFYSLFGSAPEMGQLTDRVERKKKKKGREYE